MKKTAFLYIVLAGLLWGTSGLFVAALRPYGFTTLQLTAMRGLVAIIVMPLVVLIKDRKLFRLRLVHLPFYVGIAICLFGTAALYYEAMQRTSVSTAVVLMYSAPVMVMIYSVLFLGERLTRVKVVAVALMLVGCCLVAGIVGGFKLDAIGILLGFASGVSYAIYNVLTKIVSRLGSPSLTTTTYGFLMMFVLAISVCTPADILPRVTAAPMPTIPLLLGLGALTFTAPYFLYTMAMKSLPAGTASALGIIEPMAATVFSVIFLHERLDVFATVGAVLILVAVFLLGRAEDGEA